MWDIMDGGHCSLLSGECHGTDGGTMIKTDGGSFLSSTDGGTIIDSTDGGTLLSITF